MNYLKIHISIIALFITLSLMAQTPNIVLQRESGGSLTLAIGLATAGDIQVDWGNGTLVTAAAGTTNSTANITGTVVGSNTIKLYGPITTLQITNSSSTTLITAVDVSNAPNLMKFTLPRNKLTSLDLSYNPAVYYVSIYNNSFDACALNALFSSLPAGTASSSITTYNNPGTSTSKTSIAAGKGWTVQSGSIGDGTGCVIDTTVVINLVNSESIDAKSENPEFVDPANGDFRLKAISPAINAGNNLLIPAFITTDLNNNVRINDTTVDLGCFEFYTNTAVVNAVEDKNTIQFFPNPAHDYLHVVLKSSANKIQLSDITGKIISVYPVTKSESEISLDVRHLGKGIYFLNIDNSISKVIIR